MLKGKITSIILSKLNVGKISGFISKTPLLKIPYKIFTQRLISNDFPTHIFLETTSACNLKCYFCARTNRDTRIGYMDFNLFKKIIDEAGQYGPRTFSLHLFGEPLITPNLPEMMSYIKKVHSQNTILLTTNALALTTKKSEIIISTPVDKISISFSSVKRDNYKKITGVDGLEIVEKNILKLIELRDQKKAKKPQIYIRMTVNENNADEVELFKQKWSKKNVIVEIRQAHNYGGYTPDVSLRKESAKKIKRYPCYHLWFSPAVHFNGDVSICCNDWGRETLLGNLNDQTVKEIWNDEKIKKFREYHLKGEYNKVPLCEECDVWTTYEDVFFGWQKK